MKLEQDGSLVAQGASQALGEGRREAQASGLSRPLALLFAIASGLAVANVYFAPPLLDAIADTFGMSHATIGVIIAISQLGYGLGLLLLVPLGGSP